MKKILSELRKNINDMNFIFNFLQNNEDYTIIFSDGSFSKEGIGTSSYLILSKDYSFTHVFSSQLFYSSRVSEFVAAISAIKEVKTKRVLLFVDYFEIKEVLLEKKDSNSIYLNSKIENIRKIISEFDYFNVITVKGHSGIILNEMIDYLCNGKSHHLYPRLELLFGFESKKNDKY